MTTHSQVSDMITTALKQGGTYKEYILAWCMESIELNAEAGKERPSPMVASSTGFLYNLGCVWLRLCRPFLYDLKKLEKIDWNFLSASDVSCIFPNDIPKLVTDANASQPSSPNPEIAVAPTDVSATGTTVLKMNFISQCYFFCYRVLHLGIVQQCTRYKNILEGLQRFHGEISDPPVAGRPNRGMQYLVLKLCTDSMLLSPDMLKDAVGFYVATCTSLLNNISNVTLNTDMQASVKDDWVASEANMDPKHVGLLKKLPEHVMEDIMVSGDVLGLDNGLISILCILVLYDML